MSERPFWLVLADPLSTRIFFDCGIVDRLHASLGPRLQPVFIFDDGTTGEWAARLETERAPLYYRDVFPRDVPVVERILRLVDRWLDERIGYYPLAIRLNYRHRFHLDRMEPGHRNHLLDSGRVGPLPRWRSVERAMGCWHVSRRRPVGRALTRRLRAEQPLLVLTNLQMQNATPFVVLARRLRLPVVGNVASWDHTVGKGAIWNGLERYLVQNHRMSDDLVRYHDVPKDRIVVTGWPQSDVYSRRRPRKAFEMVVRDLGLDPALPTVAVMGNTPTNTPYEERFVARLVAWWRETGGDARFSLVFRPHPRDGRWRERFAAGIDQPGIAVQPPSFTDLEVLATLLQHAACVVTNAGTILLDALVNDRPSVCVLYDEGAPPGEVWAAKSVIGEHYRDVASSGAFLEARSLEEVIAGIERCLAAPEELAEARRRVVATVVGDVDGHAADRVVSAVLEVGG